MGQQVISFYISFSFPSQIYGLVEIYGAHFQDFIKCYFLF